MGDSLGVLASRKFTHLWVYGQVNLTPDAQAQYTQSFTWIITLVGSADLVQTRRSLTAADFRFFWQGARPTLP